MQYNKLDNIVRIHEISKSMENKPEYANTGYVDAKVVIFGPEGLLNLILRALEQVIVEGIFHEKFIASKLCVNTYHGTLDEHSLNELRLILDAKGSRINYLLQKSMYEEIVGSFANNKQLSLWKRA